jgi:hypothetical protein
MTDERLDEIKTKWNIPVTLPMSVPWGKDDVVWLVGEVTRLRAEAKRADEEATKLANSDLATTEQVIRALRVENAALRAKVRTITEHYKPGWVDGLKAVARSAGFDPDDVPHDGVDPPTFIEDVIYRLRREVADERDESERLCSALEAVLGACGPACCSDCGAYYVAKRALDGEKEKP